MAVRDVITAAAGQAGGDKLFVEDVFSCFLYTGTGAAQTITNDIDLDGEGGLVWFKRRNDSTWHRLVNTIAGPTKDLSTNSTAAQDTNNILSSFNADGFTLNTGNDTNVNNGLYASWTFRKAPKFFDVVTYTGTGSTRTVSHNLGSVPGMIIVKGLDFADGWRVYHRSLGASKYLTLSAADTETTNTAYFGGVTPTDTEFTVGTDFSVNGNTKSFVAYLFAHDAGGFGDDGEQNVISCGSYTGNGSTQVVTLGYEPQLILYKGSSVSSDWTINDNMRGVVTGGTDAILRPNSSSAEYSADQMTFTATGFQAEGSGSNSNASGQTYIYIAIRRGPMKTPESGTEVYHNYTGSDTVRTNVGFNADLIIGAVRTGDALNHIFGPRLTVAALTSSSTAAETANISSSCFNGNSDTIYPGMFGVGNAIIHALARAPGFFDVVCYTGTGVAGLTVPHNLGVAPQMMIVKNRSTGGSWAVYHNGLNVNGDSSPETDYIILSDPDPAADFPLWNDTAPTNTQFTLGTFSWVNSSGQTYIAYLFATLAGVSKVGSYTGTGTTLQVNCGFSAGARFVLIKRADSTGNWYVWDTARGIVAGNDPFLWLNTTAAENTSTDYIDPLSSGFEISSTAPAAINASGGNFIFLAIA